MHEAAEKDEEDDQFCIDSFILNAKKPWTVNFKIKDTDVPFKIDTGANISIKNEKTFLQLKRKPHLSPTKVQLSSLGGRLSVKGKFFAKTFVKHITFKFRVVVVRNRGGSNLLSRTVS